MVYYLGANLEWFGRQLNSYIIEDDAETTDVNESLNVSYTYDANGLRGSKTVNGVKSDYLYLDGKLVYEKKGDVDIYYNYDSYGNFAGMKWYDAAGTAYALYALTNAQGDVLGLYNGNGELKIAYTYDTWGKVLSETDAQGNSLTGNLIEYSKLNPFRYRGYYYDSETGLYYLQSRYYDPEIGRFLNADGYVTTGQGLLSYNMFAYCGNNPVNRVDYTGRIWSAICEFAKTAVAEIGKAMGVMSFAYAGFGGLAIGDGPLPFGDIVAAAGAALLTAGAIGYGIYIAAQAPAISIPKAEEKTEAIPAPPPTSTVIYRYGGTNPGNLTPKAKDMYSGLSFSTVPMPGAAMTTIDALNATGVVYAVKDGATHVSVRPVGATMEDWISAGSGSIWTQAVKSVVIKWDGGY